MTGDALSDYDVGWVNVALDGPGAAATALVSLHRLAGLAPRVLLPSHGPIPADPSPAFATALRRAQRLADDPAGAVWYGARRIFAFALMIRDGISADEVEPYLHARAWLADAAQLLSRTPEVLAAELVDTMLRSGATELRGGRLHAAAEHTPVAAGSLKCAVSPRVAGSGASKSASCGAAVTPIGTPHNARPGSQRVMAT